MPDGELTSKALDEIEERINLAFEGVMKICEETGETLSGVLAPAVDPKTGESDPFVTVGGPVGQPLALIVGALEDARRLLVEARHTRGDA